VDGFSPPDTYKIDETVNAYIAFLHMGAKEE
jgi:hypothetical protein